MRALRSPELPQETDLLHAPGGRTMDRLTRLAAKLLHAPASVITLVREDRPVVAGLTVSSEGWTSRREMPIPFSYCSHVLGSAQPFRVNDISGHVQSPGVAYAGVPLLVGGEYAVGTLCVIDERPRDWGDEDIELLQDLAASVVTEMEMHRHASVREETERALVESERRFRQLAENIHEVFWTYDLAEERTIYASPAFQQVWGCSPERLYADGRTWIESIHPEDRAHARAATERQNAGEYFEVEYRIFRPDGEVRWIWDRGFPVRNEHGRVYRVVGIAEDVTVRRRAEAALRAARDHLEEEVKKRTADLWASERRFRALIEFGQEIVTIVAADGLILYESPTVERVLGYTDEKRIRQSVFDLVHPDDLPHARAAFAQVREHATPVSLDLRLRHRDGCYRVLSATGTNLLADPAVAGIVINLRDVTELRRGEERLRRAQRMEALGRLTGGIAHDFNNVLNVIGGTARMLLPDTPAGSTFREGLEEIDDAVARATSFTRQLLTFSRAQMMQPETLDLNAIVHGTERLLRRTLGESVQVVTRLDPSVGRISADRGQMEQVLLNLVLNARDAMPSGGTLVMETRNVELADIPARRHDPRLAPGAYVRLSVSDTGHGMTPEVCEQIFEPFFTTKPQGQGTGLGLSTVYGILQQSGGSIVVSSDPGRGTTFEILLPRVGDNAPAEL